VISMNVFESKNYKEYLKNILKSTGEARGQRTKLAEYLNCQIGFVSQVITGKTNFSLEHGIKINQFLGHSNEEAHFFMLLLEKERAGSVELEKYYEQQIQNILDERHSIKKRLKNSGELTERDSILYYSQWYYAAIHILCSIPEYQDKKKIGERLGLELDLVSEVLQFLERHGLIEFKNNKYKSTDKRIHLSKESPLISKHHINWRIEAMKSLERKQHEDLHYSLIVSLSNQDAKVLKDLFLKAIEDTEKILRPSLDEELYVLNLDWFLA
jgi:uncharacterized protein (TIGR02147 family)